MNFLKNKWVWLTLLFIALTPLVFRLADLERGFDATGGEIFFPFIPVIIYMLVKSIKDIFRKEQEND